MSFARYLLTILVAISTLSAYAETSPKPDPNEPSVFLKSLGESTAYPNNSNKPKEISAPTNNQQPSLQLEALENTQNQLQGALTNNLKSNQITATSNNQNPLTQLQELQTTQNRLKDALADLERQSNQLQSSLSALTQQLSQLSQTQQQTPEHQARIEQLRSEHQQIQTILTVLRQQQIALQTRVLGLSQQLMQLKQTSSTTAPVAVSTTQNTLLPVSAPISPPTPSANTLPVTQTPRPAAVVPATKTVTPVAKPKNPVLLKKEKSSGLDPTTFLRIGGALIALALLLLGTFLWLRKKTPRETSVFKTPDNQKFTPDEKTDLAGEYDFLGTEEAIPTRLNLARGYLEMGKYSEAREAIQPIFEKGNPLQKNEAQDLLRRIEEAERI